MEREELRLALLKAALPEVPFEGWSRTTLVVAARSLGLPPEEVDRAFPAGVREAIELWSAAADQEMLDDWQSVDPDALKVRERIATLIKIRLMQVAPHREALRRALAHLALPGNIGLGTLLVSRTVDAIWYAAGDRSTDWSFYTKRALLAGVYGATLLYFLDDKSEGAVDSWEFLDRRLGDVMQIPRLLSWLKPRMPKAA